MALANSSLAMAADHLSDALQAALADVFVIVEHPKQAEETAKSANDKHFLNIFFYKIAASGFHAAQAHDERMFLRVSALLTPFPKKGTDQNNVEDHAALRILGEVVRHFHENPVSGVTRTPTDTDETAYRIECALQAPSMEELNHIWTTQGDLAYRTSAAYEFSLIPVDPSVFAAPPGEITTPILEVAPDMDRPEGPRDLGTEPQARAAESFGVPNKAGEIVAWPGAPLLPVIRVVGADGAPAGTADIAAADDKLRLALAGAPSTRAEIRLRVQHLDKPGADWVTTELREVRSVQEVEAARLDAPEALVEIAVDLDGANRVIAEVREADANDAALDPDRVGTTLTIDVDGGPPGGGPPDG